jgi:hypothetical protein
VQENRNEGAIRRETEEQAGYKIGAVEKVLEEPSLAGFEKKEVSP